MECLDLVMRSRPQDFLVIDFVPPDAYLIYATISRAWLKAWKTRHRRALSRPRHFASSQQLIDLATGAAADAADLLREAVMEAPMAAIISLFESIGKIDEIKWILIRRAAGRSCRDEVIQWALARGGKKPVVQGIAQAGRLDILQSVLGGDEQPLFMCIAAGAAEFSHMHILEWLHREQYNCPNTDEDMWQVAAAAAGASMLPVLTWLHERRYPLTRRACSYAVFSGHLHVLQWLRARGCDMHPSLARMAARWGHLHVLKWLHEEGHCPSLDALTGDAAIGGRMHIIQWLDEHGCTWTADASAGAMIAGEMEALRWLHARGCRLAEVETWSANVIEWLREVAPNNRSVLLKK